MKATKIDLYEINGLAREEGAEGYLTVVDSENSSKDVAILIIAGGGYDHVSPREQIPVANAFGKFGYKTFILHYTPKRAYPVPYIEAALAVKYLRENAKTLGFDPQKIVGIGFSAGAHLLGMVAFSVGLDDLKELECFKLKDVKALTKLNAIIMSYPVVLSSGDYAHKGSFERLLNGVNRPIERFSLEKAVESCAPPCFIWHTFTDASVPAINSLKLADAYAKCGAPCSLHIYQKGKHGLSVATEEVCASADLSEMSPDITGWIQLCANWLAELGL